MMFGDTTVVGLAAPIQLPEGAELNDFTCYAYDNNDTQNIASNSLAKLWRRPVLSTDKESITAEFDMETTDSSSSIQSFSTPSITYPIIDNS